MKTNEEFLQGVYGKRDAIVKKRKKQMAFAATAVCAVLCIGAAATAGIFGGENNINKSTEIEREKNMASNVNSGKYHEVNGGYNEKAEHLYPEKVTNLDDYYVVDPESFSKIAEEIIVTEIAIEGVSGVDGAEGEIGIAEGVEVVTMQGDAVIEPGTQFANNGNNGEVKATMPAPSEKPMPSTEEIVEAALGAIPEDEKVYIIKDSAEATVTRYADGKQEYAVGFRTTQDSYVVVKLDSELNPILASPRS